jgi:hypothetical protein
MDRPNAGPRNGVYLFRSPPRGATPIQVAVPICFAPRRGPAVGIIVRGDGLLDGSNQATPVRVAVPIYP